MKSVLIGKLHPGDSFGETTVIKGLPMPCSVITETYVEMGTISTLDVNGKFPALSDFDDVSTKALDEESYLRQRAINRVTFFC